MLYYGGCTLILTLKYTYVDNYFDLTQKTLIRFNILLNYLLELDLDFGSNYFSRNCKLLPLMTFTVPEITPAQVS